MIYLLQVCGQTVWRHDVRNVAMPLGICAAYMGSVFARRRAIGECEINWHKRGVSLVCDIICGLM